MAAAARLYYGSGRASSEREPRARRDRALAEIDIVTYDRLQGAEAEAARGEIREIFFLSAARQDFADPDEREAFAARWLDHYLAAQPGRLFLARWSGGGLAGYLTGCADSRGAEALYRSIPHYGLFEDLFESFPAHLHINCRPEARGRGIGGRLVAAFASRLSEEGVPGVHVVTAPEARNVGFYRRRGFDLEETRRAAARFLLFMGRRL